MKQQFSKPKRMKRILTIALLIIFGFSAAISEAQNRADEYFAAADTSKPAPVQVADYSAPRTYVIADINIEGVKYLSMYVLRSNIGISRGDTVQIPGPRITQAIKKLWDMKYFSDVQISAQPLGDGRADLNIYLKERPKVYRWEFKGARKGEITDLKENLKLQPGTELSEHGISKNTHLIKKYYADKGFLNTDVDVAIANDSVITSAVVVTFNIDKHRKVRIGEIKFEGNDNFKDGKLRRSFKKTHKVSWKFFQNNKYKEEEYEADKENLIDFYNSRGYRNATVVKDSIYPIKDNRMGIKITVDEGNKYYFRNVSWVGNSIYDTEDLQKMLDIKRGDLYDKKTLYKRLGIGKEDDPNDISTIKSMYQNNGYLMSNIDPSESIVGKDSIDLEVKIYEGKPFTINEVSISGNERVNDDAIRRELYTNPGELYNRSLLMRTLYQLANMQHFNAEAIQPDVRPVTTSLVDIDWKLQEQPSDKVDISGGWGAGMFIGSVGIQLNNISLKNFFKKKAWRPYPQGQNQQLQIRGQSNGKYYKAISLSFTEPWLGGKKPNALTVSAYFSDETDAYYFWREGKSHFRTIGVAAGIGRRLNWPDQYFTLYNELSYQSYNLKDWSNFIISNGSSNIISLRTVFGRNSVDQQIYPRKGSDISLSLTLTPPYSLFDNINYSDDNLSNNKRYKWIEYHKWILKGKFFHPITRDSKLVLMARLEMGYLGHYNPSKLSPFEGFNMGGDGMTGYSIYGVDVIGMRGYKEGELTPLSSTSKNDYARLYEKYTLELRYPIILQPSSTIYGLVFAEAGNAFSSWKEFDPFKVKRAAGVGVRLYLPIVGMLGLDWGYGFDKPAGSDKRSGSQFHFSIGYEF